MTTFEDQAEALAQLQAQRADRGGGRRLGVGDEEQQVAVRRLQLRVDAR